MDRMDIPTPVLSEAVNRRPKTSEQSRRSEVRYYRRTYTRHTRDGMRFSSLGGGVGGRERFWD